MKYRLETDGWKKTCLVLKKIACEIRRRNGLIRFANQCGKIETGMFGLKVSVELATDALNSFRAAMKEAKQC